MGSSKPHACPAGTFNNHTGGETAADCVDCLPGYYCSGSNQPEPSGLCAAGYYCDGGAVTKFQKACGEGSYSE